MGIAGQSQLLWQTEDLPFNIVVYLLEQFATRIHHQHAGTSHPQQQQRRRLKGAIDANLIGYKFVHDRSSFEPDGAIEQIARAFSDALIDIHIVCDHPTKRHPSKRASCKRRADIEKARIKIVTVRAQLQSLLEGGHDDNFQHAQNIADTQKKLRSLENSVKRQQLPPDLSDQLQTFLEDFDPGSAGQITMEIAPTQADPCIAKLVVDEEVDFVISGDSDFALYVGPNGHNGFGDIMLKDLKLTMRKEPIRTCKVCTGQQAVADLIKDVLLPKIGRSPFGGNGGRIPDLPLFSGVQDPMTRALIAMIVGCDACPGGVEGSGPKAAAELLEQYAALSLSGDELNDALATEISKMNGTIVIEKDSVMCLAKSILYEKTNTGYVHGRPDVLEEYISSFADEATSIVNGPAVTCCKGYDGNSHPFLLAEKHFTCDGCQAILCRFCFMREADDEFLGGDRLLCLGCMRGAISGLTDGEDEAEMREFLARKSQHVPANATYAQVLALFKQAEAGEFDFFDEDIAEVQFPIHPTSALHPSESVFRRMKTVKVSEMEKIILDETIPLETIADFLHILASLTKMEGHQKGKKLSYRNVLPTNVIYMAQNSRVHTGERLCRRALRHAMDAGTPDILDAMLTLASTLR